MIERIQQVWSRLTSERSADSERFLAVLDEMSANEQFIFAVAMTALSSHMAIVDALQANGLSAPELTGANFVQRFEREAGVVLPDSFRDGLMHAMEMLERP